MPPTLQVALESWRIPVPLTLALILAAFVYLRGWLRLRLSSVNEIPGWRAGSLLLGLFSIWIALGSPLSVFDEQLLTVHMIQHLLLMTIAPPLILLGAPVMPFMHGLPRTFVKTVLGPIFRCPPLQRLGHLLSQPVFCWLAAAAALLGWHIPAAFNLALRSEAWHIVQHSSFLSAGFLFWWPVVQPWPSVQKCSRWAILFYLFLATLPCDILSAFLVFSERVAYPAYLSTTRPLGLSVLDDQQCAGALMWTCITLIYLLPAAILTIHLLTGRSTQPAFLHTALPSSPIDRPSPFDSE
ncbi:MAG: cytochrome c oxidase assembly protein [Candidatus Acidiferrum sp.]|jgi:cytochrome c oxidase assembly factor CtaG